MKKILFLHPKSHWRFWYLTGSAFTCGSFNPRIHIRTKMSKIRNTGSFHDRSLLNGIALYALYSSPFCETSNIVVSANDYSCKLFRSHIRPNVFSMATGGNLCTQTCCRRCSHPELRNKEKKNFKMKKKIWYFMLKSAWPSWRPSKLQEEPFAHQENTKYQDYSSLAGTIFIYHKSAIAKIVS